MAEPYSAISRRVRSRRKELRLSQVAVAETASLSASMISQLERGVGKMPNRRSLESLAVALRLPKGELFGLAYDEESNAQPRDRPFVESLRLALAGHPVSLNGKPVARRPRVPVAHYEKRIARAWKLVHASRYEELGTELSKLIPLLESAHLLGATPDRSKVLWLLADAYQIAAAMLVKMNDVGAAWIASDRARMAAVLCEDRHLLFASELRMARTFLNADEPLMARRVLHQVKEAVQDVKTSKDPKLISLAGACVLLLAIVDARQGDADSARKHIRIATGLAAKLDGEPNEFGTEFGPTNVAMHAVGVEVELCNADAALKLVARVTPGHLSAERQSRFLIDVARAYAIKRDVANAVAMLERAETVAPEEIAQLDMVRPIIDDLEHIAGSRPPRSLRALKERITRT